MKQTWNETQNSYGMKQNSSRTKQNNRKTEQLQNKTVVEWNTKLKTAVERNEIE